MDRDAVARAEELVRLLASAANAARLYPRSSALPTQAAERVVAVCRKATASLGPLRFTVDPKDLRIEEIPLGAGQSHVAGLAEQLHALQVGQLMIAPDPSLEEVNAFLDVLNTDARSIRESGGARAALVSAGVSHIAVIEVSLRASTEEGIMGLDLASAPLEDLTRETVAVSRTWTQTAAEGEGCDELRTAMDRLEAAAREVAERRVAEAMLRLDETTRGRLVAAAFVPDQTGRPMTGMLEVIARMSPGALARLLTIAAAQLGTRPTQLLPQLDVPPEVMSELLTLLTPSPQSDEERGIPASVDAERLAGEAIAEEPTADLDRQIAVALPSLASGRALATTVAVLSDHPTAEAVAALGEALPAAARDGAFAQTHDALRLLDELAADPALSEAVARAKTRLADAEVLRDVVLAPLSDADAAVVGEIVSAAGQTGAETLMWCYVQADPHSQVLLRPLLRGLSEQVLGVTSRLLRTPDASSVGAVQLLPALGDRRALVALGQALDHIDANVRLAAVRALANMRDDEARATLLKATTHWDAQTARSAIHEIGRVKAVEAVPSLLRQLGKINVFERKHDLKKEIIRSLESIGSPKAIPTLRRVAGSRFALGRKNKELRFLASRAVTALVAANTTEDRDRG